MKLQRAVTLLGENTRLRSLLEQRADNGDHEGLRRLAELRNPGTCHAWMWQVSPEDGTILSDIDFSTALRHRIGACFHVDGTMCRCCGEALDARANHALCCASAESTVGHYGVARSLADGLRVADSSLTLEVRGLVENSRARPADVFTQAAVPGRDAALDVTIAAQDASGAGADCCASAYRRKVQHYRSILASLMHSGIAFRPMVWSAEGRPHPVVRRVLGFAAELAGRRRPELSVKDFVRRWEREIAVSIQRRLARMIRACLPKPDPRSEWLISGLRPDR